MWCPFAHSQVTHTKLFLCRKTNKNTRHSLMDQTMEGLSSPAFGITKRPTRCSRREALPAGHKGSSPPPPLQFPQASGHLKTHTISGSHKSCHVAITANSYTSIELMFDLHHVLTAKRSSTVYIFVCFSNPDGGNLEGCWKLEEKWKYF